MLVSVWMTETGTDIFRYYLPLHIYTHTLTPSHLETPRCFQQLKDCWSQFTFSSPHP